MAINETDYDDTAIRFWNSLRKEERVDVKKIKDRDELMEYLETTKVSGWISFAGSKQGFNAIREHIPVRQRYTDEEIDYLKELYNQGLDTRDIITKFMSNKDLKIDRTAEAVRTKLYRIRKSF